MRHIEGADRMQESLLPESLDDYVAADDPVRVIDAYVDTLDLHALGFDKAQPEQTGRKPYNPADLLKLYVYGYLYRVSSSRRLERECARNTEVMWLLWRLRPDFKTIADFRRDNAVALRAACAAFVQFCRRGGLLGGKRVGVDGSRSKAAALERLKRRDERLERFEQAMDAEGYANGEHLQRCEDSAMTATVPRREIPGVPADRI
ncbi:MAG: transposase, partial [Burkholderiales bacterium]|nr:transposase [Burkholderiales bacterium]